MKSLKTKYHADKIEECGTDQKALFNVINSLQNKRKEMEPPFSTSFSSQQISQIRQKLDSDSCTDISFTGISDIKSFEISLDTFRPATEEQVFKIISKSPKKSCALDPIPAGFLIDILPTLLPTITQIINILLEIETVAKQRPSMLRKRKIVARILAGGAAVYKNKMIIYNKTIQICPLSTSYERLSVEHALLKCNSFDHERSDLWSRCIDVMPPAMALSLNLTSHDHKLKLLLSGLNVVFDTELLCIYEELINFMANMIEIVCEKLTNLQHNII